MTEQRVHEVTEHLIESAKIALSELCNTSEVLGKVENIVNNARRGRYSDVPENFYDNIEETISSLRTKQSEIRSNIEYALNLFSDYLNKDKKEV